MTQLGQPDLFLGCFAFGFVLCFVAFLADSLHLGHVHLHAHHGHTHLHASGGAASKFNFGTVAAFLAWFGGTGYLLSRFTGLELFLVLVGATAAGLAGGAIIFLFVSKVLARNDRPLDPEDFRIIGMLGRVSSTVFPGGTGEMIAVQQGRRVGLAIRSETGKVIEAGREVVVTRYEHGVAFVREWEELTA